MSSEVASLSLISQADLNLDGDEPRVSHHVLAERMGVDAGNIKRVVNTLVAEDEYFGALVTSAERLTAGLGSSVREHVMLTEAQSIKVVLGSKSKRRFALQHALVTVFLAVRNSRTPAALPSKLTDAVLTAQKALMNIGVRDGIATAAALNVIEQHTGIVMEAARRALPADTKPSERLNPTKLGEELGLSAREVNARLLLAGLQVKGDRDPWMLTEAGKKYGEVVPYANGKHAGNQLLWSRDVLEAIR